MPRELPVIEVREAECCPPIAEVPLSTGDAEELAMRLKAMADPHRLRLVSLLLAAPNGELCTCDLTEPLGLSQPTVSHHLKKLREAGIVTADRRGVWTYYAISTQALGGLVTTLSPQPAPNTANLPLAVN